jgi:hypothetical protein
MRTDRPFTKSATYPKNAPNRHETKRLGKEDEAWQECVQTLIDILSQKLVLPSITR